MMTREQANALAAFLRTIRPAWDHLATYHTLGELRHRDIADVAYAAIRTAQDTTKRTPKAIAWAGDHWPTARPTTTVTRTTACTRPGHEGYLAHNCPACKQDAAGIGAP